MTSEQLSAVEQFADDLRKCFPIPQETNSLQDKMRKITNQYAWDVIALATEKYRKLWEIDVVKEADYVHKSIR